MFFPLSPKATERLIAALKSNPFFLGGTVLSLAVVSAETYMNQPQLALLGGLVAFSLGIMAQFTVGLARWISGRVKRSDKERELLRVAARAELMIEAKRAKRGPK